MTKQSMAQLVAHLERHGYVERIPDPADGRAKLVRATERGREVFADRAGATSPRSTRGSTSAWARRRSQRLRELLEELNEAIASR